MGGRDPGTRTIICFFAQAHQQGARLAVEPLGFELVPQAMTLLTASQCWSLKESCFVGFVVEENTCEFSLLLSF